MNGTIAALSTPNSPSAIAVIRLSGPDCAKLAMEIFSTKEPEARRTRLAQYKNMSGRILDDVLFTYFKSPASYTGEDMLEISCHGNPLICSEILRDLFERGCSPAQPGEFTRRAFLNDKMDLSQAEAVALTIEAKSLRSLEAARRQMSGELGEKIRGFSGAIADISAIIEAYIDFPDEDLPDENKDAIAKSAAEISGNMQKLIDTARYAPILRGGINISIAGAPNAGKSSIMNALLGEKRAIVSPVAGTTRDVIGERMPVGDHFANLLDTAGLRDAEDAIEAEGIALAMEKISHADMKLLILDSSAPMPDFPKKFYKLISKGDTIIVLNKTDISASPSIVLEQAFPGYEAVKVSCKTGEGISELKTSILRFAEKNKIAASADDILVSARHADALARAKDALLAASEKISNDGLRELAASDLREALDSLGEIVGKTENDEILDRIFSSFCIGK